MPVPQSEEEAVLLRYAVVLKNTTSRAIIAYYVRWRFVDANGEVTTSGIEGKSFPSGGSIPPHGAKFLSCDSGIGLGRGRPIVMSGRVKDLWDRRLQFYPAQRSIEASVELAVFDDGTAVGPDGAGRLPILKAWMDAERDFARMALAENSAVSLRQRVQGALDQGLDALPRDQPRSIGSLSVQAAAAASYSECYKFATAWLASNVVRWINESGEDRAIDALARLTSKSYPVLRKKE